MNVVRDLRNTITHLQAQLQQKQKQFIQQQQQYQEMLTSIQIQNQKLKMLLHGDSVTHKDDDFLKIQQNQQDSVLAKKQNIGIVSNNQYMELINQNIFLKNQITELSQTYQKQIDQLVFYFDKIKQQSKKNSHGHFIGQISLINNWVKSFMKDYQTQKDKYNRKLAQYAQTLQLYQNKIIEQQQTISKMKNQLKQSQDKIKIATKIRF